MHSDVVVIGAGQAGLSAAYGLRRAGLQPGAGFVVLDGDDGPGGAWQHRWPTLTIGDTHRIADLPGLPFPDPDPHRPAAEVVSAYFAEYERLYGLDVRRPVRVTAVRDAPAAGSSGGTSGTLLVETDHGSRTTRAVINATGTWTHPFVPHLPGQESFRGRQLHAASYTGPEPFAGLRVAVVGGGLTAVELLLETAPVAAGTVWLTRRPPVFVDEPFDEATGRAVVAKVAARVRAGLPPQSVISATGLHRTPHLEAAQAAGLLDRHPLPRRMGPDGFIREDGTVEAVDVVLWATGWPAALDHLRPLHLRAPGGGIAVEGTRVLADPRIHLVGYGPGASTIGANRAGRAAARAVVRAVREPPAEAERRRSA